MKQLYLLVALALTLSKVNCTFTLANTDCASGWAIL